MKKRLLSAALALAMVLTLLPMSVFAATTTYTLTPITGSETYDATDPTNPVGKNFTYQAATTYGDVTKTGGRWYWTAPADSTGNIKVYEVDSSGFLVGSAWYPNSTQYEAKNTSATIFPSSFTLLDNFDFASSTSLKCPTTLNVDVNGHTLTLPALDTVGANDDAAMTNVTITDKLHPTGHTGTVIGLSTSRSVYNAKLTSGLTVNATNVDVGTINLAGRGNTVILDNCASDGITMNGTSLDSAGKTSYARQGLTTKNSTTIGGAVTITGDGSAVDMTDTKGGNSATISVTSVGGSVKVAGNSAVGKITVSSGATGATNTALPSVTVNGGTVNGIERNDANSTALSSFTINKINDNINITGNIVTTKGSVSVTNAKTAGITVNAGSLTVGGTSNDIGAVNLGATANVDLTINATGTKFTSITAANGANLTIKGWPATRDNNYGTVSLGSYRGKGIKGGTFAAATGTSLGQEANMDWVDNANIQFIVPVKAGTDVALYNRDELTEAVSSIAKDTAAAQADCITILGQGDGTQYIVLMWGKDPWVYIKYKARTDIALPTRINNTGVANWIIQNGSAGMAQGTKYTAGSTESIGVPAAGNLILAATDTTAEATKITNAQVDANTTSTLNGNVRVELKGNNIEVSGAVVATAGGSASIYVDLTTDVVDKDGSPVVIEDVEITYNVNTKKVAFASDSLSLAASGAIVQDGALVLNRGTGAKYTVSANLSVSATDLNVAADSKEIQATAGGRVAQYTPAAKKALLDQIEAGEFTWTGNKAMLEAINAAQATITSNTSVSTWIANAKDYIWKNGYTQADGTVLAKKHTGNYKDFVGVATAAGDIGIIDTNFAAAYIVPYLVVNVTEYGENGTMTATLTPYYRVDVSAPSVSGYDPDIAYTVQAGRALSALTGDMTTTPVTVKFGGALATTFDTSYMHQDGKYVYQATTGEWSINHAGKNGLGTVVINSTEGAISFDGSATDKINPRTPALPTCTYDSLQAAVDDTVPGVTVANTGNNTTPETMDTIKVDGNYKGSCDFTMTGYARKIKVVALGDLPIKCTSQDVDTQNPSGYTYTFQLKRDTAPTGGNITVASATGGSASVSANPAAVGSTVTVTLSANAGYTASGVSVKTSSGQSVSVSGSGSSYSFTMPSGSVTVTPTFTAVQQTNATVSVSNPAVGGTASTSAGSNRVAAGTTVTVTTSPGVGQRTMGVYVTGATATRTGANSFAFTVPSGYTNVVVTPRFDVNNGTLFEDVWSTDYYSNAVAWAVGKGITNGDGSSYRFGSGNSCTRQDMVTFLWRNAGSPVVTGVSNPFYDVQPGSYYYNAVMWAVKNGITQGVTANQFGVGQTVTRAQAVTFLYRASGSPSASANNAFYDVPSNEYYSRAVTWAANKGITNGDGGANQFNPSGACLRAQIVTFMYRNATLA